ncbi:MAG: hypothetical protein ACW98Y_12410 [Candidatus Thorarchaeota archaeon]|jgi:hypothetical protein
MTLSREEDGNATPRCEWCGIEVPGYIYLLSIGKRNFGGVFCSRSCRAAESLRANIFFTIVLSALLISIAYTGYLMPPGDPSELASRQFRLFFSGIMLIIGVSWVLLGFKVRRADSKPR